MNKTKAIGGCLVTFLGIALGVGLVGWLVTAMFPKSYAVVSFVGGLIVLIAIWNAVDSFIKILKKKGEASPSVASTPAGPSSRVP